ncbi:MAG: hypothetical protein GY950_19840, partial [bacterium]|nr:hypothetical protein [bacterium]
LRNRIRHHVVPEIQKIDPDIDRHIFRTVSIIQEEYDYFSETANAVLNRHLILGKILPAHILDDYHPAVQRHVVREYLRLLKGNLLNIDFHHIETIRTGHREMGGLAVPGVELTFHKGFIFPAGLTVPEYNYPLPYAGTEEMPEIQMRLTIEQVRTYKKPKHNYTIFVPAAMLKFPLTARNPQKNDKYVKINSTINQDVFEIIRASGTPSELRNLCPVFLDRDGRIIWAVGSPVADSFKVRNQEENKYFKIAVKKKKMRRIPQAGQAGPAPYLSHTSGEAL